MLKIILTLIFSFSINAFIYCQNAVLDSAVNYFNNYKFLAQKDNGKLWGVNFNVPIEIVNPKEKLIIINREVSDSLLFTPYKNCYYKKSSEIPAGSGEEIWGGYHWAKCSWKILSEDSLGIVQMFHEAFHRNQDSLNLRGTWSMNTHLNEIEARNLLYFEIEALKQALNDSDYYEKFKDALIFRQIRYKMFPKAKEDEASLELQEGLASYSGFKLAGYNNHTIVLLTKNLIYNNQTFAYYTGLLYGYIFDKFNKSWTKYYTNKDNFLSFSVKFFSIALPKDLMSYYKTKRIYYNWQKIEKEQDSIQLSIKKKKEKYDSIFFKNQVLVLKSSSIKKIIFQSDEIFPYRNGKIFNHTTLKGEWGILVADGPIFFSNKILITKPIKVENNVVFGIDWKLTLIDNWVLCHRKHDYFLKIKNK